MLTEDRIWQAIQRPRGHQNPHLCLRSRTAWFWGAIVGPKDLGTPTHFISGPWPMLRKKKCPRKNKENPDCQDILPRTTLSSADQGHGRRKWHTLEGSPPRRPKQKDQHSGPTMGAWWRSNSRKAVTSALNACSWQSSHINEEMTPKQYHPVCCNSQQVEKGGRWDRHSSGNLHDQQMYSQDQRGGDI